MAEPVASGSAVLVASANLILSGSRAPFSPEKSASHRDARHHKSRGLKTIFPLQAVSTHQVHPGRCAGPCRWTATLYP